MSTLRIGPDLLRANLEGRCYVVTGGNSGIGYQTVRFLASRGARVILAARSENAGRRAAGSMRKDAARGAVETGVLDLADLASVERFAKDVLERCQRIDALVNNAGIMAVAERQETANGFEMQFGVNHIGHFHLTNLLLERLKASAPARIVIVSSSAHAQVISGGAVRLDLDDLNYERRPYHRWLAYGQSKLANLVHAEELARRLEGSGVTAVAVHPGLVRTNLARHVMPKWLQTLVMAPFFKLRGRNVIGAWDGAQTTLHCLLDDAVPSNAGAYYAQSNAGIGSGGWPHPPDNAQAGDEAVARRLWDASERMVTGARSG